MCRFRQSSTEGGLWKDEEFYLLVNGLESSFFSKPSHARLWEICLKQLKALPRLDIDALVEGLSASEQRLINLLVLKDSVKIDNDSEFLKEPSGLWWQ